jgi:hypothetical protein
MTNYLFILGASDPEMSAIESLLRDCGQMSIQAVVDGARVHPGNAYRHSVTREQLAEGGFGETMAGATLVFVECGADPLPPNSIRVDHHRPGDPGFGQPPEDFLSASSIGQIISLLGFRASFANGQRKWGCVAASIADHVAEMMAFRDWDNPPQFLSDAVMIAAADHCLAAAYRGECPGVSPEALRAWRIKSRAEFQDRSELEILADVERAEAALKSAPRVEIDGVQVADLRGPVIPELPEAATYVGIPYLASIAERDGREKVVISAPESALRVFMDSWAPAQGLTGIYGDPVRGFAGAYV